MANKRGPQARRTSRAGQEVQVGKRITTAEPGRGGKVIDRVQTGVRMERRLLLVLKALAGSLGLTLGDLLEGIVLHAFEGKAPFRPETRATIDALRGVYGLDLVAADSHLLVERRATGAQHPARRSR